MRIINLLSELAALQRQWKHDAGSADRLTDGSENTAKWVLLGVEQAIEIVRRHAREEKGTS